jgi:hypothetical protein
MGQAFKVMGCPSSIPAQALDVYVSKLEQSKSAPQAPHRDVITAMDGLQSLIAVTTGIWSDKPAQATGRKRRLASFSSKVRSTSGSSWVTSASFSKLF